MEKLSCTVILYNPTIKIIEKIKKYVELFDLLILVDNSNKSNNSYFTNIDKICYISLGSNKGIAYALNVGIKKAIENNFKWCMTLDQDSIMTKDCIKLLQKNLYDVNYKKTAIVSANYEPEKYPPSLGIEKSTFVITSGSIINTYICEKVGFFISDMFIDAVDYEYCYRIISLGYNIERNNSALFFHTVGNPTFRNNIKCSNYPPFRYYFITRNNLIVSNIYKDKVPESKNLKKHIHIFLMIVFHIK